MRPKLLPLIAAGSGDDPPQRWGGPFAHLSDLTAEELADWTECDDAPEISRPAVDVDGVYAHDHGR